jgi:hypothetical protein
MRHLPEDEESWWDTEDDGDVCPVCKQEYHGVCPIHSAQCPYQDPLESLLDDESDFKDVDHINLLVEEDKEVEDILEEADREAGLLQ